MLLFDQRVNEEASRSGQGPQSGHSDGDREKGLPEIDLGEVGQPGTGARTSAAVGQPTHSWGDPDGSWWSLAAP